MSVCPSVTNRCSFVMDELNELVFDTNATSLYRTVCLLNKSSRISKNNSNFVLIMDLEKFSHGTSTVAKCCQLSLTDDCRRLITLNVHICVQHDDHDAARRADLSASVTHVCFAIIGRKCIELNFRLRSVSFRLHCILLDCLLMYF